VAQVAGYVLWFWWPHPGAPAVAALLALAAAAAAWSMPAGPVRRFCLALLAVDAVSTVAFVGYAAAGIDELNQHYIGYFYWSAPLLPILVLLLAGGELLAARGPARARARWRPLPVAVALAGCAAFAVAPQTTLSTGHADPGDPVATGPVADPSLPAGVAAIARTAGAARYAVLAIPRHDAWPAVTGILVQAERSGVPACVAGQSWEFMMTSQFICTREELADGARFSVWVPGSVPRGMPVVFRLRRGVVTNGPK
jgi:hypothetical protein